MVWNTWPSNTLRDNSWIVRYICESHWELCQWLSLLPIAMRSMTYVRKKTLLRQLFGMYCVRRIEKAMGKHLECLFACLFNKLEGSIYGSGKKKNIYPSGKRCRRDNSISLTNLGGLGLVVVLLLLVVS